MISKTRKLLQKYGLCYTIGKVIGKIYIRFLLGRVKVNRRITIKERKKEENTKFANNYCVSIVVPLYNTPENFLIQMIESVCTQTYANWQLCLTDGSDEKHGNVQSICQKYAKEDSRICYKKLEKNLGISENTNAGLEMARGEYIALFDHDDLLHPSALYEVMCCVETSGAEVIYTDEATFFGKESRLLSVHRKPDFFMENLCADNYICHLTVFKKSLLQITGGFRKEYDGSQDHDMIFRLCEVATKICHIPKVLYFWRAHENSVALHTEAKKYVVEAGVKAVKSHFARMNQKAIVEVLPVDMLMYRVTYEHPWSVEKDVTIIYEEKNWMEKVHQTKSPFILLLQPKMKKPEKETLQFLLMHMAKDEVVAVAPMIVDERGKIIATGVKWDKKKKAYVPKYKGHSASEPGEMNELLTAAGMPAIVTGCMLLRTQLADENFLKKIRKGHSRGVLINEPRARICFLSCK